MKTIGDVALARLRNERLTGDGFAQPADVVRWLGAVQAQDYAGAKWAVGLRARGRVNDCVEGDVERAFADGLILRTHVLRPTWHFVVPEDVRWMLALTGPRVRAAMAPYDGKLELTERLYRRGNDLITKALRGGNHLTREELGGVLGRAGIQAAGQRLGHFMLRAELDAVVCSGPRRGKQFTYALLDERIPAAKTVTRDDALTALAARYFTSHGPALLHDFAWWSGLTITDARRGVELAGRRLVAVTIAERTYWQGTSASAADQAPARRDRNVVHLLPNFDEYFIAYRDRSAVTEGAVLPPSTGARDGLFANNLILVDGRLAGTWRRLLEKKTVIVETRLLRALTSAERKGLAGAAERLASFLRQPVNVRTAAGTAP